MYRRDRIQLQGVEGFEESGTLGVERGLCGSWDFFKERALCDGMSDDGDALIRLGRGCTFGLVMDEFAVGVRFEEVEDRFGARNDLFRNPCNPCHLDTVASICGTIDQTTKENDFLIILFDGDRGVFNSRENIFEFCELVVMGGKERSCTDFGMDELGDGPCEGEPVISRSPASDFIEDDEGMMFAVSVISTMKVDWPRARLSLAPTREKMRSTRPMWACSAGTKEPICAMRAMMAA